MFSSWFHISIWQKHFILINVNKLELHPTYAKKPNYLEYFVLVWDSITSSRSFDCFKIHMWLTPIVSYILWQYLIRPCFIVVRSIVSSFQEDLVVHLLDPTWDLSVYGFLWSLGIQYIAQMDLFYDVLEMSRIHRYYP